MFKYQLFTSSVISLSVQEVVVFFFHGDPASVYLCLCDPGIRQLQLMLLKVSLVLGVEIHVNVEFIKLLEPPAEQNDDGRGVCVSVSVF